MIKTEGQIIGLDGMKIPDFTLPSQQRLMIKLQVVDALVRGVKEMKTRNSKTQLDGAITFQSAIMIANKVWDGEDAVRVAVSDEIAHFKRG